MQISQWNDTIFECHVSTLNAMFKHFCYDVCRDGSGGILYSVDWNKQDCWMWCWYYQNNLMKYLVKMFQIEFTTYAVQVPKHNLNTISTQSTRKWSMIIFCIMEKE